MLKGCFNEGYGLLLCHSCEFSEDSGECHRFRVAHDMKIVYLEEEEI